MGITTLDALKAQLSSQSLVEAYAWFGFDYAHASSIDNAKVADMARDRFLERFDWRVQPTSELVCRLFNQVNMFFAERWVSEHPAVAPSTFLLECNRLTLYRQGKATGWRTKVIEFGLQTHLDFLDPRRRSRWLTGLDPGLVRAGVAEWHAIALACPDDFDTALAITMVLIAIHPFADGNGRLGRLALTWLSQRFVEGPLFLDEGSDGEFLRTGEGIERTDYLMAMLLIRIGGGHNIADVSAAVRRSPADERLLLESITKYLRDLREDRAAIFREPAFLALREHLLCDGHVRRTSPRFESLRSALT